MAHLIDIKENGKASMAYTNEVPWHTLGNLMVPGASLEEWSIEADMSHRIESAPVCFLDLDDEAHVFSDQKVLYRSDNKYPLSIVHQNYKEIQPITILEWFDEFIKARMMSMETAGTMQKGRKMWALAKIDKDFDLGKKDIVKPYVLLATSCDKSLATTARLTYVRVVCNNTLQMAYADHGDVVKINHRTAFDQAAQTRVKEELGLVESQIEETEKTYKSMVGVPLKKEDVVGFFLTLFASETKGDKIILEDLPIRKISGMFDAYQNAPGQDMGTAKGSLWGAVNAVSYMVDHNPSARSDDSRLNSAWFGQGAALKNRAVNVATEIIEEKRDSLLLDAILANAEKDSAGILDKLLDQPISLH